MKVVQVNGWLGHLMYPLLEFLEAQDADVVCLQEVLSNEQTNPLFESFSMHQQLTKRYPHHHYSPTYTFPAFGQDIGMGNLIVSKHPITSSETLFVNGEFTKSQTLDSFVRNIRNAQICSIDVNGTSLAVVNHHGFHDLNPAGTEQSLMCIQKLIDKLKPVEGPLIMCGDFNVQPNSAVMKAIAEQLPLKNLTLEYILPTTLSPIFRVKDLKVSADYIFTSQGITVQSFEASDVIVSDHKALILDCIL